MKSNGKDAIFRAIVILVIAAAVMAAIWGYGEFKIWNEEEKAKEKIENAPISFSSNPIVVEDEVGVVFNDGGVAKIKFLVHFNMNSANRKDRFYIKGENLNRMKFVIARIEDHLSDCSKTAGSMMSTIEHVGLLRAEYGQLVYDMLKNGIYKRNRDMSLKKDKNGNPIIRTISPLKDLCVTFTQFEMKIEYDAETKEMLNKWKLKTLKML